MGVFIGFAVFTALLFAAAYSGKVTTVPGKTYHVTGHFRPMVPLELVNGIKGGLSAGGASGIELRNEKDRTVVEYNLTAVTAKEVELGKPLFKLEGLEFIIDKMHEV